MTDTSTGYTWLQILARMTGEQSDAFLMMQYQIRKFLEAFSSPTGNVVVLWTQSALTYGSTDLQKLPDCLVQLETFVKDHNGDPTGFCYGIPTPTSNWWDGRIVPFKAFAGPSGCDVWKIGINEPVVVGIADTQPVWKHEPLGYEMDVSLVVIAPSAPTWFVVAKDATHKWVCLASETVPQNP